MGRVTRGKRALASDSFTRLVTREAWVPPPRGTLEA
jgi:hypothetical protein